MFFNCNVVPLPQGTYFVNGWVLPPEIEGYTVQRMGYSAIYTLGTRRVSISSIRLGREVEASSENYALAKFNTLMAEGVALQQELWRQQVVEQENS